MSMDSTSLVRFYASGEWDEMWANQNLVLAKTPAPVTGAPRFLKLPEGAMPSREVWIDIGKRLVSYEKNIQWVLGEWWIKGERSYGDGRALAEEIGIGYQTVRNYASVVRAFDCPDRRDNLSFGHHEAVAALPAPERNQWLDQAERDELSVIRLRQAVKVAFMKDRRARREQELAAGTEEASKALGKKVYGVIYADPPWRYDRPPMGDVARLAEAHYPCMALEDIKALPIPAAENCVLFLWATVPLLPQALEVMAAWGFEYKTASTWVKDKAGTGYWVRGIVEHLLIGRPVTCHPQHPATSFPASLKRPAVATARSRIFSPTRSCGYFPMFPSWKCLPASRVPDGTFGETRFRTTR